MYACRLGAPHEALVRFVPLMARHLESIDDLNLTTVLALCTRKEASVGSATVGHTLVSCPMNLCNVSLACLARKSECRQAPVLCCRPLNLAAAGAVAVAQGRPG